LRAPSKQQLENTFGTAKDVEVIKYILEHGKEQPVEGMKSTTTKNAARSSISVDTRGKSNLSGI
jgi:ribosome maturation protein Sdo1